MQVCRIVKGQRYSRKLNECQVTRMLRLARETPEERENSILEVNFAFHLNFFLEYASSISLY